MFIATAPPREEPQRLRLMLVELLLGDLDGHVEVLVGQLRIDDLMAVLGEAGRFDGVWRFGQSEGFSTDFSAMIEA
jgi:hypothetical protein